MKLETFKKLHGFFIEDLQLDQTDKIERRITEKDIDNFAKLTGDNNPVHTNLDFAKKTIFKEKVAHGFLSASLISSLIATKLPGPGSIYLSQNLKFLAPVFIDDLVTVKVTVKEIDHEKKKVKLQTECFKNEKKIISGEAIVLVNSKKDFKNNESF
jgi:3-hydroxybutyryl-CoA dehydratase